MTRQILHSLTKSLLPLIVMIALGLTASPAHAFTKYLINPCTPDAATTCDNSNKHQVYTPTVPARNQLAVFLGGTKSKPNDYDTLSETLANHGYHVINLRHVNGTSIENSCDSSYPGDQECHRRFRAESAWGENVADPNGFAYNSTELSINLSDSITNRLLKLVNYLSTTSPYSTQGWSQFRNTSSFNTTYNTYNPVWSLTAMGGHSQGSGASLYAAKFYDLLRVAMLAGPQDSWDVQGQIFIAPWVTEGGFVTVPTGPGSGIEIDPAYVKKHTVVKKGSVT